LAVVDNRLSPDDARILALETEAIAGHTLKLLVLEPGAAPLDVDGLRASVDERLPAGSRGRDRVELEPEPCWAHDEHLDLAAHIRRVEGSEGLDWQGLRAAAARLMAERLDHARPLWRFDVLGPLADGREAIVCRIHHAMADGLSCVRFLGEVLWEQEPSPPAPGPARPAPGGPVPHSRGGRLARLPGTVRRELGPHASATVLDRHVGSGRDLAFADAEVAELKRVGASRPEHATVNDVLLAAIAGGMRGWLDCVGSRLPRLRAQIPVSLHHRDEAADQLGNRDSFLNVDLPLAEPDPLARVDAISAQTRERKSHHDAEELYDLFHALARFKRLDRAVERLATGPREFSLSISNVPGPRTAVSVAGRTVERLCSVAEPADRHALRVAAISCAGNVGIGLCTDPQALPGVGDLATAIDASFAELRAAGGIG
jgi:hypothetical protein